MNRTLGGWRFLPADDAERKKWKISILPNDVAVLLAEHLIFDPNRDSAMFMIHKLSTKSD